MNQPKITIISTERGQSTLNDVVNLTPVVTMANEVIVPTGECNEHGDRECFSLLTMKFYFYGANLLVREIRELEIKVTPR
jgi:hypothetical protein